MARDTTYVGRSGERSLLDKLGVKPDSAIAVVGVQDQDFWQQLRERAVDDVQGWPSRSVDLIFLLAESKEALQQLAALEPYLERRGAIWVVSPRGKPDIKDVDVIAAAKQAGLVDNKVVRFSDTHTALRLVIPLARR